MPLFTQNLLKKIIADKAFESPHYHEIENTFTSQFMIRLSPRPDIFSASLKHMNKEIYKEMQGPSQFILSGQLQSWSVTQDLWKIQGE
jgi:proline iminopeptidase